MIKKIINFIKDPKHNYSNIYYIEYHLLKLMVRLGKKLRIIKTIGSDNADMFNWRLYNLHYRGELREEAKVHTMSLAPGDYAAKNGKLEKTNPDIKPLHANHHLLYETILQLKPEIVIEMGCGNGMHLHNLYVLAPDMKLLGTDKDERQLAFLRECYPDIKAEIRKIDATSPLLPELTGVADLSFTQAVIMHIHTNESHLIALKNLFNFSKKYVVMMERWKNHSIMDDIKKLHEKKLISWQNLYFYYRINEETKLPHIMICSNEPLSYNPLKDYNILVETNRKQVSTV
ncbi:hypothetical protein A2303_04710 [Candidatus Falkowbacteria bacterium RIFOXYB2_FULL_47_14]|uniref:Methyltransferase type 11 domain-containing protein n=1 Tax=Candidatus Falkowbacteria bacterium RIFOXYA2_FULL_47_19 TaxID=1797994 RepID=A0A1F5SI01_9BACT|nr:MAG: hypothetical protein A2227_02545 [Candidatus Falkowbacteria bacterium RIFOXYA2_FULL_47_19]OGF35803.1 MAG: hypothetical protein A2468_03730 [Candidatus Falkowbacteria bacterium RIFOXYC2_FULL_46_15]OGF42676.1 MAG: hypothetical protein A2303_04710 [Candidatus Falkowbacteria bacterium RIFOXYB2_FULL_47_14]